MREDLLVKLGRFEGAKIGAMLAALVGLVALLAAGCGYHRTYYAPAPPVVVVHHYGGYGYGAPPVVHVYHNSGYGYGGGSVVHVHHYGGGYGYGGRPSVVVHHYH